MQFCKAKFKKKSAGEIIGSTQKVSSRGAATKTLVETPHQVTPFPRAGCLKGGQGPVGPTADSTGPRGQLSP